MPLTQSAGRLNNQHMNTVAYLDLLDSQSVVVSDSQHTVGESVDHYGMNPKVLERVVRSPGVVMSLDH
jgi:hypothetical protein